LLIRAFESIESSARLLIVGPSSYCARYEAMLHDLARDDRRIIFVDRWASKQSASYIVNAWRWCCRRRAALDCSKVASAPTPASQESRLLLIYALTDFKMLLDSIAALSVRRI